jgi:hypothetical protein
MRIDPEICERARLARDPRFDGQFFIGVRTTGIDCRPICRVHPPKPENIRFYPSAALCLGVAAGVLRRPRDAGPARRREPFNIAGRRQRRPASEARGARTPRGGMAPLAFLCGLAAVAESELTNEEGR